jgi:hypothetical protein
MGTPEPTSEELQENAHDADYVLDDVGAIKVDDGVVAEIQADAEAWVGTEWPNADPEALSHAATEVAEIRLRACESGTINYWQAQQLGERLVEQFG